MSVFEHPRRTLRAAATVALCCVAASGCQEQTPVALVDSDLPGQPISVEVDVPWSEFASDLEVFGGYGAVGDIGEGLLAEEI